MNSSMKRALLVLTMQGLIFGCASLPTTAKKNERPSPFAMYLEKSSEHIEKIQNTVTTDAALLAIVPSDWMSSGYYKISAEGLQRRVVAELGKILPETAGAADFVIAQPLKGDAKFRSNYDRFADVLDEFGSRDKTPSERSSIKRFVESVAAMEKNPSIEDVIQRRVRHWAKTSADLPRETSAYNLSDAYILDDMIQDKLVQRLSSDPELIRELKQTQKMTLKQIAKSAISATPKAETATDENETKAASSTATDSL